MEDVDMVMVRKKTNRMTFAFMMILIYLDWIGRGSRDVDVDVDVETSTVSRILLTDRKWRMTSCLYTSSEEDTEKGNALWSKHSLSYVQCGLGVSYWLTVGS